MGWLIALAIVVGLAILPLGVSARYNGNGADVKLLIGPFRMTLFPQKKKEKKKPDKRSKATKKQPKKSEETTEKGGKLSDFLPLVDVVLEFLGDVKRKLRVKRLELKLIMAGDDPCDLALNYGRAWAAVGNLFPRLEEAFVIKKRDIQVACDFTAEKTLVIARLDITITIGRVLSLGFRHGIRALREFLKIMKLRKGGATQ